MANSLQDVCITPRNGGGEEGGGGLALVCLTVSKNNEYQMAFARISTLALCQECMLMLEAASTFALDDFKTSVDQLQQIEFYFSVHCMKQTNKRRCVRSLTDQRKWRQNEVRTSMAQADHQTLTSFAVFQ